MMLLAQPEPLWMTSPATLEVMAATAIAAVVCVIVHYEVLNLVLRWLRTDLTIGRRAMIIVVLALLIAHVIEITLFGLGFAAVEAIWGARAGTLIGEHNRDIQDTFYFSGATYTTVGFGDIVPVGPIRFMVATEALTGLVLITWSASFTFLIMQNRWRSVVRELRIEGAISEREHHEHEKPSRTAPPE